MANKTPKEFKAMVFDPNNTDRPGILMTAKKSGGYWMVGGDYASALKGMCIYIQTKGGIYSLRGSRLVFQDFDDGTFFVDPYERDHASIRALERVY